MRSKEYIALKHRKRIEIYWEIADVQADRPDLSDDQAEKVIEAINEAVDFTEGVNWSTIWEYANKLFPRVENIK